MIGAVQVEADLTSSPTWTVPTCSSPTWTAPNSTAPTWPRRIGLRRRGGPYQP
jgi:hypothetical protein